MISMILIHKSSMPSHSDSMTRYCRNTLDSKEAACTRVSLMPSRSDEKTSGLSRRRISGNSTSPKMAVHSECSSSDDVKLGDRSDRCSELKARWRISRHGLVHCVVRALNTGSQ